MVHREAQLVEEPQRQLHVVRLHRALGTHCCAASSDIDDFLQSEAWSLKESLSVVIIKKSVVLGGDQQVSSQHCLPKIKIL